MSFFTHICGCEFLLDPWPHVRHCQKHSRVRRIVMSLDLAPGATAGLHATAYLDDANTEVATEAVIRWRSDNEAVAQVTDLGSAAGVGACTVTAVSDTDATCSVIATANNADGTSVDSAPDAVTIVSVTPTPPPPSVNAVGVVITQDAPPAPPAAAEPPAATEPAPPATAAEPAPEPAAAPPAGAAPAAEPADTAAVNTAPAEEPPAETAPAPEPTA